MNGRRLLILVGVIVAVAVLTAKPVSFAVRWWRAFEGTELDKPERRAGRALAVAHAAFESGFGKGTAARLGRNPWNLTRTASDTRPIILGGDTEPDGKGGWRKITQRFRSYSSDGEAARDYLAFLRESRRYKAAYAALLEGNVTAFPRLLRDDDPATAAIEGGYFTAPLAHYEAGLSSAYAAIRAAVAGLS